MHTLTHLLLLITFHKWGNWGTNWLCKLFKVTQLVSSRAKIQRKQSFRAHALNSYVESSTVVGILNGQELYETRISHCLWTKLSLSNSSLYPTEWPENWTPTEPTLISHVGGHNYLGRETPHLQHSLTVQVQTALPQLIHTHMFQANTTNVTATHLVNQFWSIPIQTNLRSIQCSLQNSLSTLHWWSSLERLWRLHESVLLPVQYI